MHPGLTMVECLRLLDNKQHAPWTNHGWMSSLTSILIQKFKRKKQQLISKGTFREKLKGVQAFMKYVIYFIYNALKTTVLTRCLCHV